MRIVFTGGGTGGHIYPALAMADIVKEHFPGAEILFVGATAGMEERIVQNAGYPIHSIKTEGLKRKLTLENIRVLYHLVLSLGAARKWLKDTKPDLVIGTGGYVSYPVVRMASLLGIPTAIHESNAIPGLAVRMLARHADRIWLGMENAATYFPHQNKIKIMGNPLRSKFTQTLYAKANAKQKLGIRQKEFLVLSFGGSLGAKQLNDCMYQILCQDKYKDIRFYHICGEKYKNAYPQKSIPKRHTWIPYSENMPQLMEGADLVICRAGAMTISEVSACKKVSVLIPSPHVAKNHQYYNAKAMADKDAAFLLTEETLTPTHLESLILHIKDNPHIASSMQRNLRNHFLHNTTQIFLEEIELLLRQECEQA